jgi:hypothetical protein
LVIGRSEKTMIRTVVHARGQGRRRKWQVYEGHDLINRQWPEFPTVSDLVAPKLIDEFDTEAEAYAEKRRCDERNAREERLKPKL